MKTTAVIFVGFAVVSDVAAWMGRVSLSSSPSTTQLYSTPFEGEITRRNFARNSGMAIAFLASTKPALADETEAPPAVFASQPQPRVVVISHGNP